MLVCKICGHTEQDWLGDHIVEAHSLHLDAYLAQYPYEVVISDRLQGAYNENWRSTRRAHPPDIQDLKVTFAGLDFSVFADVPQTACLPWPAEYVLPQFGKLGKDVACALVSLYCGRSMYLWGQPGTGKDALIHAWSAATRTPAIIKQVIPGADIESWFFSRSFNSGGTFWEEGDVLKAARDGYLTASGRRVPYLLLFSDIDRADRAQAEYLRLITDSIQGRISGPTGTVYNIFPGTRVVVTANTPGSGDFNGQTSANPLDASILDRFERKFEFHPMDWRDEEPIVRAKFPLLVARCPWVFGRIGAATEKIRAAIADKKVMAEFSHRGLCAILGHAQDLVVCSGDAQVPKKLLREAARAWWDGHDEDTREAIKTLMDPHFKGGTVDEDHKSPTDTGTLADI